MLGAVQAGLLVAYPFLWKSTMTANAVLMAPKLAYRAACACPRGFGRVVRGLGANPADVVDGFGKWDRFVSGCEPWRNDSQGLTPASFNDRYSRLYCDDLKGSEREACFDVNKSEGLLDYKYYRPSGVTLDTFGMFDGSKYRMRSD